MPEEHSSTLSTENVSVAYHFVALELTRLVASDAIEHQNLGDDVERLGNTYQALFRKVVGALSST